MILSKLKHACLAAASIAAVLAASCTAPKPPEGKILIEFWDFPRHPLVNEWLIRAIDRFEKDHPEVDIQYTRLSWAKGTERMDIAAFAGRPPDVAGAVLNLKYAEAGLLEPLDKYIDEQIPDDSTKTFREDIYPAMLRDVQWNDTTWSFPWYKEGFVIVLNKDIFAERGVALPVNGQWTWDEFKEKMRQLTFDRDGDGDTDVYGLGFSFGKEKWEAYSFLFASGMRLMSEDGRTILTDSAETRDGINRLLELEFEEKVSLPGSGGIMDDTTWTAFTGSQRSLAAVCQGLWAIKSVETSNKRLEEQRARMENPTDLPPPLNIAVALYPQMPDQPQVMASYGVGSLMVFKRSTFLERTEWAARFARYLTLEAEQEINKEAGIWPSRVSTGNLYLGDERYEHIGPHIPDAISPPTHPLWIYLTQVVGDNLQLAMLRRKTVDQSVVDMTERCQAMLDDFWETEDAKE